MLVTASLAAAHYLALGLGLGGIFFRGKAFRSLMEKWDSKTLSSLFLADNLWGLAAFLWIITGTARAFGGFEKGSEWYLHNPLFLLKMTLFLMVFLLEIFPMITLIRWRIAVRKGQSSFDKTILPRLHRLNQVEVTLVVLIPFIASAMARGLSFP